MPGSVGFFFRRRRRRRRRLRGWSPASDEIWFPEGERLVARHGEYDAEDFLYTYLTLLEVTTGDFSLEAEVFEDRHGEPHPDAALLDALAGAGVELYVCGQSAAALGFEPDELAGGARLSPSAMTAFNRNHRDRPD